MIALSRTDYDAVIFDMDGVITRTADVHEAAWKQVFDEVLGPSQRPFDNRDYRLYVDGRDRLDGTRGFLQSRGLELPEGTPDDPPGARTVHGISKRKNAAFLEQIRTHGVEAYPSTLELIHALRKSDFKTAVISASRNAEEVLRGAGALDLFDARVDGKVAGQRGLQGKPAPDVFVEAARELGTPPGRAVVVEDAVSGVQAGRRGGFALVIGVDRGENSQALAESGADAVVLDLEEVQVT